MPHLIRYIALRHLTAAPGRTLLTVLGVVLGVALVFAIDVVNGSVMASFRQSIDRMAGKTDLVVGEGTGVDEELLEIVRAVPGVAAAAPVIQQSVRDVTTGVQLAVLGVDTMIDREVRDYSVSSGEVRIEDEVVFLNDPRGVLLTQSYATKHGLSPGETLMLETVQGRSKFNVHGTLAPQGFARVFGGDLLVMDVYAAQVTFERGKRFDRLDVVSLPGHDLNTLSARISEAISQRATIRRPEQRTADAERILAGFRLGLSIASLVAMLVGGFIVYNALAIAVAQRRREIGVLRALGATRRQIIALFVGEGLLIGVIGSALGLGIGLLLGRAALATVGSTISALYLRVKPEGLAVAPSQLLLGLAVGIGASLIASLFPARRASSIEPAAAMRKKLDTSDGALSTTGASLKASGVTIVVGLIVAYVAHIREDFLLGASVALFVALACAFLAPVLARGVGIAARRLAQGRPPAIRLGVLGFERNTGRNAIAIAALGMALGNVVNIGSFLDSIKQNTVSWFERSLKADLLVFAGQKVQSKFEHPLPASLGRDIGALPGVAFVNPLRMSRQEFRGQPFYLFAYDLLRYRHHEEIPVVDGDLESGLAEIAAGRGIAASEAFASEFQVGVGDVLTLQTPQGPRDFRITLVYVDYSTELGILTTTREVFTEVWKDTLVDTFGIYLEPGADAQPVRERVLHDLGAEHQLMVLENADYKAEVIELFDRSFSVMRAMEVVAIIVALLGIVNTLVVSVIDRTVELGILKAIGAVRQQVRRMFITEALLIGTAATMLGLAGGYLFSFYTVKELLRFQMGWNIAWQGAPLSALETIVIAQLVAVVGAWFPMRSAAKLDVVEALQYE